MEHKYFLHLDVLLCMCSLVMIACLEEFLVMLLHDCLLIKAEL